MDLSDQKTQLMLLGGLGALALLYVWFTYVYTPRNERIGELEGQVSELQADIRQLELKVRQLPEVEAELQVTRLRWEEILRSFPTEAKEEEIFGNLTISEHAAGLYISSITKGARRTKELYIEDDYAVDMMGRYTELERFIRELASMPRRMTVQTMQLTHPAEASIAGGQVGAGATGPPPQEDEVIIRCTITTYQVRGGG